VKGLRLGVPENFFFDGLAPEVERAVREAVAVTERLGVAVKWMRVPDPTPLVGVAQIISSCEGATIHSRLLRERPHELQPVVRTRLDVGLHVSAVDYLQATRIRSRATRVFVREVFDEVDLLLAPVVPEPALPWSHAKAGSPEDVARRMGRFSRLTRPLNALGLPAVSLPCGTTPDHRPLAVQIVGRPFDEAGVLRLARACERETGWTSARPSPA
jgi:aspartyl-tRNA(Asn)/glutamyl-tRNA(Gln) amidotransferase subunit A